MKDVPYKPAKVAGKGSKPRPTNLKRFGDNWGLIKWKSREKGGKYAQS